MAKGGYRYAFGQYAEYTYWCESCTARVTVMYPPNDGNRHKVHHRCPDCIRVTRPKYIQQKLFDEANPDVQT